MAFVYTYSFRYVYIGHIEGYSAYTKIHIAQAKVTKRGANGKRSLFYFIRCTMERKYGEYIFYYINSFFIKL